MKYTIPKYDKDTDLSDFIPAKASIALVEYIGKNIPEVPLEYSLLVFYTKVAQTLGLNRTMVKSELHIGDGREGMYLNMYTILFLGSGIGKDRVTNLVGQVFMKEVQQEFYTKYSQLLEEKKKLILDRAKELYPNDKKQRNNYVRMNEPHNFAFELSRGTPQGVYSYRKSLKDVGYGCVTFQHGEFADYYMSKDDTNQMFLDIMIDGYYGDTKAGVLKTERSIEPVLDVPMNMLVHSANTDFLTDANLKKSLYSFLSNGMARRSFVCVTKGNPINTDILVDDYIKNGLEVKKETEAYIRPIQLAFYNVYRNVIFDNKPAYTLSPESDRLLAEYKLEIARLQKLPMAQHIAGELRGRAERAMKLACIMSAYEYPEDHIIDVSFLESAIGITEYYGNRYRMYFEEQDKPDYIKLIELLIQNKGEWVDKTSIKEAKVIRGSNFTQGLNEAVSLAMSSMFDKSMVIEEKPNGSRGTIYRIIDNDIRINEAETNTLNMVINKLNRERNG
jgi:hypothetical protein